MLPRNRRIPRKFFSGLIRACRPSHSQHFFVRSAASDAPRIAVSVSKKVSKQAVVRNRIRRRAYSAAQGIIDRLPNRLFLLIAKPGAEKVKGAELKMELAELLAKR